MVGGFGGDVSDLAVLFWVEREARPRVGEAGREG